MRNPETIQFDSAQTNLVGKFYFPQSFEISTKWPLVIMATGDGKNGSNSGTWMPLINGILAIDIPVFIFDFYGLGNSKGEISKLTPTIAIQNLVDAVATVKKQSWVDKKRIGSLSSSFGGAISLIVQSKYSCFKILGLKSPVSFLAEVYESELNKCNLFEWQKHGIIEDLPFDFKTYLDSIKYNIYEMAMGIHSDVLIVQGDADTIVPLEESIRLACLLPKAQLKVLKNVNHGYKEKGALEKFMQLQTVFFQENL